MPEKLKLFEIADRLHEIDDLVGALWMAAAALDNQSQVSSIRRVVEVIEDRVRKIVDACEKTPPNFPPSH